ncbi:MAG: lytic transglycosylase domain-containing protein, partial [Clostridia bacterium]
MKNTKFSRFLFYLFSALMAFSICAIYIYDAKFYPIAYIKQIEKYSTEYGADGALITSIINAESGFNRYCVSSSGALGLMQMLPRTAEWVANQLNVITFNTEMLYNADTNIKFGTFYFMYLYNKFNSVSTALACYNAGEGLVANWLDSDLYSSDGVNIKTTPYPATNAYLEKIEKNFNVY